MQLDTRDASRRRILDRERVSVSSSGRKGNSDSSRPSVSGDGRLVAFDSTANTLVPGDTNHTFDVFVHDRATHRTMRVSQAANGGQASGASFGAAISADGRFVAFDSQSTNLVAMPVPAATDNIYVKDLRTGHVQLVSVNEKRRAVTNAGGALISADGRYVAFSSFASDLVPGDTNGVFDVFVRDRLLGSTTRASVNSKDGQANGDSRAPAISADGQQVAFASSATNLVPADTNGVTDIFVHDSHARVTQRVNVGPRGVQATNHSNGPGIRGGAVFGPAMSAGGRYVTFDSIASNLVAGDTRYLLVHWWRVLPQPGRMS